MNQRAELLGYLFNPFLKSTKTKPNLSVKPEFHSQSSMNVQGKKPFTFTPLLQKKKKKRKTKTFKKKKKKNNGEVKETERRWDGIKQTKMHADNTRR